MAAYPGGVPEEELYRLSHGELVQRLRKAEGDKHRILGEHADVMKEVNRKLQVHLLEIRGLKEVNQRLQDDNQELRDLCCFLDDDRQKSRKLAREWQRFGRYTASVMRSEVTLYQTKLTDLEQHQGALLDENTELKRLALFLDDERSAAGGVPPRDDGDGSSSSSPAAENPQSGGGGNSNNNSGGSNGNNNSGSSNCRLSRDRPQYTRNDTVGLNEQTTQYIRDLETRLARLEPPEVQPNSKPEAVVRAMRVLDVHEQAEGGGNRPSSDDAHAQMSETERAILRGMCGVAWSKLGDRGYPDDRGYHDDGAV